MIRWRLRLLMAERKISNKELAELANVHPTSISKLKNSDAIEQISGRVLNSLCNGLTRAYRARGEDRIITPCDLLDYTFDRDEKNFHIETDVTIKDKMTDITANSKVLKQ